MARRRGSRNRGRRRTMSAADKELFKITKIWFHAGGALQAMAMASGEMQRYQAMDIADLGKKAIVRGSNMREANEVAPSGQYYKTAVADKPGKPPRRYKPFSFQQHAYAADSKRKRTVVNKGLEKGGTFKIPSYIAGPVRFGEKATQPRINGRTAMFHQKGKTAQARWHRMVPAIPLKGRGGPIKPNRWDGASWRHEYSHKKIDAPVEVKEAWWQAMHRFGMAPDDPVIDGMEPTYDFAWQRVSVKVKPRRDWMAAIMLRIQKKPGKYLNKAKGAFPKFARKFIKYDNRVGKFRV